MKEGVTYIYVGRTGSGKTIKIREMIHEFPMLNQVVYDPNYEQEPNREWMKKGNYPYDEWTVYHKWKMLMNDIENIRFAHLVLEDATVHLSSMAESDVKELLVSIEHRNNAAHIVCHRLLDVPPVVIGQAHYMYLFKTGDFEKSVLSSRFEFYEIFMKLKKNPDKNAWCLIDLRETDQDGNFLIEWGSGSVQYG